MTDLEHVEDDHPCCERDRWKRVGIFTTGAALGVSVAGAIAAGVLAGRL